MEEPGDEDDEDMDGGKSATSETILRDFNYKLRCMFMERNRNLRVTGAQCSPLRAVFYLRESLGVSGSGAGDCQ